MDHLDSERVNAANRFLVDILAAKRDIRSPEVFEAFRRTPRHLFLDAYYDWSKPSVLVCVDYRSPDPNRHPEIFSDIPLLTRRRPRSSVSQPGLVASMLEILELSPGMRVLEIGTGTGWNAALIAFLVGEEGSVVTIENQPEVANSARKHLRRANRMNVRVVTGDGWFGWADGSKFDRIVTTAKSATVSPHWFAQLKEGGSLVVALEDLAGDEGCVISRLEKSSEFMHGKGLERAMFMPLLRDDVAEDDVSEKIEGLKSVAPATRESPWLSWIRFFPPLMVPLRELMFFVSLEGLIVRADGRGFLCEAQDCEGSCRATETHLEECDSSDIYDKLDEVAHRWVRLRAPKICDYEISYSTVAGLGLKPGAESWVREDLEGCLAFRLPDGPRDMIAGR